MIYLRAALYAEGPSDYDFLLRLTTRVVGSIAAGLFPGNSAVEDTIGIDAPCEATEARRADRIAAAVDAYADLFELLIIHADGAGDPRAARGNCVEPGIAAVHAKHPGQPPFAVGCVPVRETEAWMLTDVAVFRTFLGSTANIALPADPEREVDPKLTLQTLLRAGGMRRPPAAMYALFGEKVGLNALRRLPTFQAFEAELTEAIRAVARSQGLHRA